MLKTVTAIAVVVLGSACATFYETTYDYNRKFEEGSLDKALESLRSENQYRKPNVKFLYYANNGILLSILGKYEESNNYFEKAFLFGEDYRVNVAREAAAYFTNPMVTVYRGEDHEHLMVLYYKAMNFLKMGRHEEALVECRRLNIRLQQLSDRYSSENKYRRDAFVHVLMGIIYQADNDWNNAFIAYRNAYEIYEEDYGRLFGVQAPDQLKADLLRAAWNTGFTDEFDFYKSKFNWPDFDVVNPESELVFFWHNGLSPIKDEWSINFVVNRESDNMFLFSNPDMNMRYSFYVGGDDERTRLSSLEVFRVAFPRYLERPVYYTHAEIVAGDASFPLQLGEDVNRVAIKCLQERMGLEFSKSLLRVALKKSMEYSARKEDRSFGALIGAINSATEKADTRNWQTLPHSIFYSRIPLKQGANPVVLRLNRNGSQPDEYRFTYTADKGQTLFHTFTSLESLPASRY
jgi:hypothetical protein